MVKSSDLFDIHRFFEQSKKIELKDMSVDELSKAFPNTAALPDSKMGTAMKEHIQKVKTADRPISVEVSNLIYETVVEVSKDKIFYEIFKDSKAGKFSCFTSSLKQTRHWISADKYSLVRGEPKQLACLDFDLAVADPPRGVAKRLMCGPMVASWGEGGFGILQYAPAEILKDHYEKIKVLLTYKELRRMNLKLKLQSWELKKEK